MQKSEIKIGKKISTSISMSNEQLELLDLICLSYENSRSAIIIDLIESSNNQLDKMILKIAERIVADYNKDAKEFDSYLKAARIWLAQKKISAYHIKKIIEEAKKIHGA